jgi:hypothetical protein
MRRMEADASQFIRENLELDIGLHSVETIEAVERNLESDLFLVSATEQFHNWILHYSFSFIHCIVL